MSRAALALAAALLFGGGSAPRPPVFVQAQAQRSGPPEGGGELTPFSAWRNRPREPFAGGEKAFRQVKKLVESSYVDTVSEDELWRGAVEGMLARAGGRRWDKLLSPAEHAELLGDLKGEVVGVGVEIRFDAETGLVAVRRVLPGSGAAEAGLRDGDQILKIDGRSFRGQEYRDVLAAMRGKAGSRVELAVLREDRVLTRAVRRTPLAFDRVSTLALPRGIALVSIRSFTEKTPDDLKAALVRIGSARALVLDLRHNPGGLLDRMLDCAGMLLPGGSTVATLLARGREQPLLARGAAARRLPMVVLVDEQTASSAEVLAGALRAGAGARLVGRRTQGKWNAQRIEELGNGYVVRLTVGILRAPSGELPDGKGIAPDVPVEMAPADFDRVQRLGDPAARLQADPQLATAFSLL